MQTRCPAFTLTELLVALTISSIIMLAVVGSFGLGLRVWRKVEDRQPIDETSRRVLALIRRELAGVYLPSSPLAGVNATFQDEGPHKISFFTANPGYHYDRPSGLCARVTYEYKDGVLTRSEEPVATDMPLAAAVTEVLAEELSNVTFACIQGSALPSHGSSPPADSSCPPELVQVRLEWPTTAVTGQFLVPVREPLALIGQE
jgi:prepilin-type N-terminal cleavage/methylation domain-containing protein